MCFIIVLLSLLVTGFAGFAVPVAVPVMQDAGAVPLPVTDVAYGDGANNLLNVYLPDGPGPFPVVLLFHGTDVSKDYFAGTLTTDDLIANGYAAVSADYRVPTPADPFGAINDAACALAWIYASGDTYPFDTRHVIVLGHSRGAAMAALLGVRDDLTPLLDGCAYTLPSANPVTAVVTYGGNYASQEVSFTDPMFMEALRRMAGMSDEQMQALLAALAAVPPADWRSSPQLPEAVRQFAAFLPLAWLDGSEPPFLVVHGEIDEFAPAAEARVFAQALEAVGVPVTLAVLPGQYHRINQEALHEPLLAFLDQVINAWPEP